ncbi:MAG: IS4 family transposase, partial [bacterium]
RIKAFYGTSENAVRVQVWIAIAVYVLIAIVRKRASLPQSPYTILQILSITLFEKTPIFQVFSENQFLSESPGMLEEPYLPGFLTGQ